MNVPPVDERAGNDQRRWQQGPKCKAGFEAEHHHERKNDEQELQEKTGGDLRDETLHGIRVIRDATDERACFLLSVVGHVELFQLTDEFPTDVVGERVSYPARHSRRDHIDDAPHDLYGGEANDDENQELASRKPCQNRKRLLVGRK